MNYLYISLVRLFVFSFAFFSILLTFVKCSKKCIFRFFEIDFVKKLGDEKCPVRI